MLFTDPKTQQYCEGRRLPHAQARSPRNMSLVVHSCLSHTDFTPVEGGCPGGPKLR